MVEVTIVALSLVGSRTDNDRHLEGGDRDGIKGRLKWWIIGFCGSGRKRVTEICWAR